MTDKYIEISKEAAEASGRDAYDEADFISQSIDIWQDAPKKLWLVHDNEACAELAAEYRIDILHGDISLCAAVFRDIDDYEPHVQVYLADHNNERMLATNYAILSAVIEINKARGLG